MIGHNVLMIEIQALPADRLSIIAEIDRSEHVDTLLEARAGELTSRPVDIEVPRWTSEGSGPESVEGFIGFLGPILERGATLLGAFDQETWLALPLSKNDSRAIWRGSCSSTSPTRIAAKELVLLCGTRSLIEPAQLGLNQSMSRQHPRLRLWASTWSADAKLYVFHTARSMRKNPTTFISSQQSTE
jgi:hypothetical protein